MLFSVHSLLEQFWNRFYSSNIHPSFAKCSSLLSGEHNIDFLTPFVLYFKCQLWSLTGICLVVRLLTWAVNILLLESRHYPTCHVCFNQVLLKSSKLVEWLNFITFKLPQSSSHVLTHKFLVGAGYNFEAIQVYVDFSLLKAPWMVSKCQ